MTNQEELEEIIFNAIMDDLTKETREYLAKYILDRGFVKKDSIELDEEKIIVKIACVVKNQDILDYEWVKKIAHAIAEKGKDIVK